MRVYTPGVVQTDKRSASIRARKMLVFVVVVEAVTDGYKTRYIGGILRAAVAYLPAARVWCVLHVIIFGIVGERWQASAERVASSLPRCSPLHNRLLYERAQIWLRRRASIDFAGRCWRDLVRLVLCKCEHFQPRLRDCKDVSKSSTTFLTN